ITAATRNGVVQARFFTRRRHDQAYSGAPRGHRCWLPKNIRLQTLAPPLLKTPLSQSLNHTNYPSLMSEGTAIPFNTSTTPRSTFIGDKPQLR
ncbi:unnamed protein product, partial [Brassica rapa subsp. narinosa]